MATYERRPQMMGAANAQKAAGPLLSLPRHVSPPLESMTPRAQEIWLEAYRLGYEHGIGKGIRQADEAEAAAWRRIKLPNGPDHATLCERRGEHEKAAATRRLWAERGIA